MLRALPSRLRGLCPTTCTPLWPFWTVETLSAVPSATRTLSPPPPPSPCRRRSRPTQAVRVVPGQKIVPVVKTFVQAWSVEDDVSDQENKAHSSLPKAVRVAPGQKIAPVVKTLVQKWSVDDDLSDQENKAHSSLKVRGRPTLKLAGDHRHNWRLLGTSGAGVVWPAFIRANQCVCLMQARRVLMAMGDVQWGC